MGFKLSKHRWKAVSVRQARQAHEGGVFEESQSDHTFEPYIAFFIQVMLQLGVITSVINTADTILLEKQG